MSDQNKALLELLKNLQEETTKQLIERIASGEATGSEFSAAIQMLKNNNITVDADDDEAMDELEEQLNKIKSRSKITKLVFDDDEKDFLSKH